MAQPMYNKSEIIHVNQDRIANRHDEAGVTGSDANLGTLLPIQCTRIYHNGTNIADGGILGLN